MKKFIISILCVAVFFIGLGNLVQETGARFKSDERALDLIKKAQAAIGGEEAISNVKSLSITGTMSKTFDFDGAPRTEQGEVEMNLQLPNQFAKSMKLRHADDSTQAKNGELRKQVNVMVMREGDGSAPVFKQADSTNNQKQDVVILRGSKDGKVVVGDENSGEVRKVIVDKIASGGSNFHRNDLLRTTLALLMTAPQGTDVTFVYVGDGDVDGNACDIVEAQSANSNFKLFLDKSSHLPRMISYQGFKPVVFKINKDEMKNENTADARVLRNRLEKPEPAEFQVKFSDYRAVNGVLLPYRWTQTIGGNADETIDISSYEINPANIAEKFQNLPPRVMIRTEKKTQ
jgi:hypothetical protein